MTEHYYGESPEDLGPLDLSVWDEFMHYLYLPVRLPRHDNPEGFTPHGLWIPERLGFMYAPVRAAWADAREYDPERFNDPYIYLTMRRGYATPGNPLNRPGWHCDDFGGEDLNYIWSDVYPTRLLTADFPMTIREDDVESMVDMDKWGCRAAAMESPGHALAYGWPGLRIEDAPAGHVLRLNPYVVHDTPEVPAPGGMRSFFKISFSDHRYNLKGNSHNHLLPYRWEMHDRESVRNQPGGNKDYVEEQA